eukprot:6134966-Alexandrium_andersonii.AAC.1
MLFAASVFARLLARVLAYLLRACLLAVVLRTCLAAPYRQCASSAIACWFACSLAHLLARSPASLLACLL